MGIYGREAALALILALAFVIGGDAQESTTTVPAIVTFGDSAVDVRTNDYIPPLFKANYPPYGRDFVNQKATGMFCNGKLATDVTADDLGFTTYPPAYLSPQASGKNFLIGANFASAASGYDDKTAILNIGEAVRFQDPWETIGVIVLLPCHCSPSSNFFPESSPLPTPLFILSVHDSCSAFGWRLMVHMPRQSLKFSRQS